MHSVCWVAEIIWFTKSTLLANVIVWAVPSIIFERWQQRFSCGTCLFSWNVIMEAYLSWKSQSTQILSIRLFSDKGHYVSSWNSVLSQIRKDVNLLVANMELQLKMEWAVSIVKLHQMSVSYSIWSSHTCMSKQGALFIRKKRIGERTTSSGILYGWSLWGMSIGKSKEHRTEAKIWSTLLSRFRWYVWISTDQLMSCLQTKPDIFLRWSLTTLDSFVLFVCVRRTRRHKWRLIKMNPDHW